MMIRVMVVEDEPPVQRSICRKIQKINPFFKVTEVADNGCTAIEILEKRNVDVMFVDINLPVISGIEVLEYIKRKQIDVIPVVLSGYKDFEYVKSAFSNNVYDYLLKPLKDNELKILLDRIRHICKERDFEEKGQNLEKALTGLVDTEDMIAEYCMMLFTFGYNGYSAGNDKDYSILFQQLDILNKISAVVPRESFWLVDGKQINEKIIFIRKGYDPEVSGLNRMFDQKEKIPCSLTIVYNREGVSLNHVYGVYEKLRNYTKKNMIFMKSAIFDYCEEEIKLEDNGNEIKKQVDGILEKCIFEGTNSVIEGMKELLDILTIRPVGHKEAIYNLRYFMTKLCKEYPGSQEYFEFEDELQFILENSGSIEEMKNEMAFLIKEHFSSEKNGNRDKQQIAQNMKEFLDKNFRTNITNQKLAERYGFVASYLSTIFKSYYDMTPIDYVNYKKMEEAKQLLTYSGMKIKEVSNYLGYQDSLYFSKVFKKETGVSPKEYIKNISG